MAFLDCETKETIYTSVGQILGLTKVQLSTFLQTLDLENDNEFGPKYEGSPSKWILGRLKEQVDYEINLDGTYWFHLSRVLPDATFEEGILPLGEVIERIWKLLYSLVATEISLEEWEGFRERIATIHKSHSARLYRLKVPEVKEWGPYAMLVREIAFKPTEVGNHDYFSAPEIVEDICQVFETDFKIDLLTRFQSATKPCIVKFFHHDYDFDNVGTALYYLYCCQHNMELSLYCNTCYRGAGGKIEAENIAKVEFVEY